MGKGQAGQGDRLRWAAMKEQEKLIPRVSNGYSEGRIEG